MTEQIGSSVLEKIRRFEIGRVRKWFDPAKTVLEIGGADGLQASVIASWGCSTHSIDIADRPRYEKTYYPVDAYDGGHLPFADASTDIIFSSNVLEHIRDVSSMLAEIRRVIKNDGLCLHILPSSSWRFWTMVTHYPYLLLRAVRGDWGGAPQEGASSGSPLPPRRFMDKLKNAILPPPHGEYATSFSELYTYSAYRWRRVFRQNGFQILTIEPAGLFYTGHNLCPFLPMWLRRGLAFLAGSASLVYVLKKSEVHA